MILNPGFARSAAGAGHSAAKPYHFRWRENEGFGSCSFVKNRRSPKGLLLFLAERMGFEPMVPFGIAGFQDQFLKPLGHLSVFDCAKSDRKLIDADPFPCVSSPRKTQKNGEKTRNQEIDRYIE